MYSGLGPAPYPNLSPRSMGPTGPAVAVWSLYRVESPPFDHPAASPPPILINMGSYSSGHPRGHEPPPASPYYFSPSVTRAQSSPAPGRYSVLEPTPASSPSDSSEETIAAPIPAPANLYSAPPGTPRMLSPPSSQLRMPSTARQSPEQSISPGSSFPPPQPPFSPTASPRKALPS